MGLGLGLGLGFRVRVRVSLGLGFWALGFCVEFWDLAKGFGFLLRVLGSGF